MYFNQEINTDNIEFTELRLRLNFKHPNINFKPRIGINMDERWIMCGSEENKNINNVGKDFMWMWIDSHCIQHYSDQNKERQGTFQTWILHHLLKSWIFPHKDKHKMILIKKSETKEIKIIMKGESHFNISEESKEEPLNWSVCLNKIEDKRWNWAECYNDGVIIDLCPNCWESHDKIHNLIMLTRQNPRDNWSLSKIFKISDNQDDEKYTCLTCGESLTQKGIAISFNVEIQGFSKVAKKIENDFLICLKDFNEKLWEKLEYLYPKGYYSLVEWVIQYNRKNWHDILENINKGDLINIIGHQYNLNSDTVYSWNIWESPIKDKIWVWMDQFCLNLNIEEGTSSSKTYKNVNTLFICDKHIGINQMSKTNNNNGHKVICFLQGKILKLIQQEISKIH